MMFLLSFLVLLLWTIKYHYKRRRLYELAAKLPTVPGENPVIGHAYHFMGDTEHIMSVLLSFGNYILKSERLARFWLNHLLFTGVVDSVDINKVARSNLEKDDIYRIMKVSLGNGIIFAPVSIWKKRRKNMIPAFSSKNIANYFDVFVDTSAILADKLESLCGTGEFDVWPYVYRYTFDSTCESMLGMKLNSQDDWNVPFLDALNRTLPILCERMFNFIYHPDWLFKLFRSKYKEQEECRRIVFSFIDEVISSKISADKSKTSECLSLCEKERKSLLEYLIHVYGGKEGHDNVEIREELLGIILAATDSTSVAICNTLVLLAKYPDIQKKLHQELSDAFENSNQPFVKEDLQKLKYLERIIKESLRLFPPVPIIARKISDETLLPSGYVLPAGSGAILDIWDAHRDPKYWGPNADHFDPDRFLPERSPLPNPSFYMPFSTGPRNCIGAQYAMMSLKVALSTILRRYKINGIPEEGPVPRMRLKIDITMKAVDGYQISLEKKVNTH